MTPSRTLAVGALALCLCACAAPAYAITDTGAGGQNDVGADTPTVDTTNFGVWTTLDGDADQTGAPGQSDTTDVPIAGECLHQPHAACFAAVLRRSVTPRAA